MDPELLALLERLRARRSPAARDATAVRPSGAEAFTRAGRHTPQSVLEADAAEAQARHEPGAIDFILREKLVPTNMEELKEALGAMVSLDRDRLARAKGTLIPELLVSLLPGPGEVQAGRDVAMDVRAGEVGWGTALAGVGMIPAVGILPRGVRAIRGAVRSAGRAAKRVGDLSDVAADVRKAKRAVGGGGEDAAKLKRLKETGLADEIPGGGVNIRPGEGDLGTVDAIKRAQNIAGKDQFEQLARTDVAARGGGDVAAMSGTEDTARRIVRERDALTSRVLKQHKLNEGSTTHVRTGVEPDEGFGVSVFKDREFTVDNMTQADLDTYIQKNRDILDLDDVFLGTWRDTEAAKDVIDVSKVMDNRFEALSAGHAAKQKAIWDFKLKKEVKVPKPERLPNGGRPAKVDELFAAGREGADWYENLPAQVEAVFGKEDAPMFIRFLASTSQATAFRTLPSRGDNINLARRAFAEWKAGEKFGTRGSFGIPHKRIVRNLERAAAGEPLGGQKIRAFERALTGDTEAIVLDRHMLRAFGYKNLAPSRIGQRLALEDAVRAGAKRHGLTPRQYQAAVWEGQLRSQGKFRSVVIDDPMFRGADVFGDPLPQDFKPFPGPILEKRAGRFPSLQKFLDATVGGLALGTGAALNRKRREQ